MNTPAASILDLDSDLPSLASQAAIELDNLRLKRAPQLTAVGRLAEVIRAAVPPRDLPWQIHHLDFGSTLAVNRAAARFAGPTAPTHLNEILPHVWAIAEALDALAGLLAAPDDGAVDVSRLKAFCLELSRQAANGQRTSYERPAHPYRRLV